MDCLGKRNFDNEKKVSINITKIIKNVEKINIMRAIGCDEKYINGRASDFEWFDEWERILPLAEGHREAEHYEKELSTLGISAPRTEYSRERSIARWKQINGEELFESAEDGAVSCAYAKSEKNERVYSALDINKYVSEFTKKCHSIKELATALLERARSERNTCITLKLDISGYEYTRPDPYLSERCYSKYICDEKLNPKELMAMYAQILIELIIPLKREKKLFLWLVTDGDISHACALIRYIGERKLFGGELLLSVTAESDTDALTEVSSHVFPSIRVFPVTDGSAEDKLGALFYKYPKGAFVFSRQIKII